MAEKRTRQQERKSTGFANEIGRAFRDYAQYTIMQRAIPTLGDGLKPVQRRIIFAMHKMGLTPGVAHKKSARVVGEVIGKYHPHGDAAVYDTMTRMAQDFALLHPLVDGQGNFGSIDGDRPAAFRYTEARLAPLSLELLRNLNADTVDWVDNFDSSLKEPTVLPAAYPNVLVNGATGIAVGFSSSIPPHNLAEVCDAVLMMCDRWKRRNKITVQQLMEHIRGPDLPTGGVVFRYRIDKKDGKAVRSDSIQSMYQDGRGGGVIMQAAMHVEDIPRRGKAIIVTAIPYGQQKTTIIERIQKEVQAGRISGITDMVDESDFDGMRLVIHVSRQSDANDVMEQLVRRTTLRSTFSTNFLVLVPVRDAAGPYQTEPITLGLGAILQQFIFHRLEIIQRRSRWELGTREARLHIVTGLLTALESIDEVIATIKRSRRVETARMNLRKRFRLTVIQAQAILDMRLRRLAAMERKQLQDEAAELKKRIAYLKRLLKSGAMQIGVIKDEIREIKKKFAKPRRTVIVDAAPGERETILTTTDLEIPQGPQVVVFSPKGIGRRDAAGYSDRGRAGKSSRAADGLVFTAEPTHRVLFVAEDGQAWTAPIGAVPEEPTVMTPARVVYGGVMDISMEEKKPLVIVTSSGRVKRMGAATVLGYLSDGYWGRVIGLDKGDKVVFAAQAAEGDKLLLFTPRRGLCIRTSDISEQSTPSAKGVVGMNTKGDLVVGGGVVTGATGEYLVLVTTTGRIKKVSLKQISIHGRGGQGVALVNETPASGIAAAGAVGVLTKWVDVLNKRKRRQRIKAADVPGVRRRVNLGRKSVGIEAVEVLIR